MNTTPTSTARLSLSRRDVLRGGAGLATVLGSGLLLTACGADSSGSGSGSGSGSKTHTLKVAALPNISDGALLALAKSNGWYSKAGLSLSEVQFDAGHGSVAVESLGGGKVDVAGVGSTPALLAAAKGALPLRIISVINNATNSFTLFADGDISDVKDLAGKKIAYTKGSVWEYFVRQMLATADMSLSDVQTVDLAAADGVTAFIGKHVDAVTPPPPLVAKIKESRPDAHVIFTGSDFTSKHPFGVVNPIVVTEEKVSSAADALKELLKVYHGKVVPYLNDSSTHDKAIQGIVTYIDDATGGSTDPKTIKTTVAGQKFYDTKAIHTFMTSDELHSALESQAKFFVDTGAADKVPDLDKLIDTSLLPSA